MSQSDLYSNGGTIRTSNFNKRNEEDSAELRALKSQQRDNDLIGNAREEGFREGFSDFERRLANNNQYSQTPDLLGQLEDLPNTGTAVQSAFQDQGSEQAGLAELTQILNNRQL